MNDKGPGKSPNVQEPGSAYGSSYYGSTYGSTGYTSKGKNKSKTKNKNSTPDAGGDNCRIITPKVNKRICIVRRIEPVTTSLKTLREVAQTWEELTNSYAKYGTGFWRRPRLTERGIIGFRCTAKNKEREG